MMKQLTIKNIIAYLQGNIRYALYYSRFKFLIRKHIREQIKIRIDSMDRECFNNGSCKLCGCKTTALQMANKACDKPCYPKMFSRKKWNKVKEISREGHTFTEIANNNAYVWMITKFTHNQVSPQISFEYYKFNLITVYESYLDR